jgi:hypothetical protein
LNTHGYMSPFNGKYELEKVSVSHNQVVKATAVDIAPLRSKRQQRGIDE